MRWEVRKCDYCDNRTGPYAMPPEKLDERGWGVDDEGRDICPTCSFCEDTEPLTPAKAAKREQ